MSGPAQKWLLRVFLLVTCSIALYAGLVLAAGAIVRERLSRAVHQAGARMAEGHEPVVEIDLWGGDVHLGQLLLEPGDTVDRKLRVYGRVDTLSIHGLSYWGLLRGRLEVDGLFLETSHLAATVIRDTSASPASPERSEKAGFDRIAVDAVHIRSEHTSVTLVDNGSCTLAVAGFNYDGSGLSFHHGSTAGWSFALPGERTIRVDSVYGDLRGEQCASIGAIHLDQRAGTCSLSDLHFGPYDDLEPFAKQQALEIDVADVTVPSIHLRGLHIPSRIGASDWSVEHVAVMDAEVTIFRDKTRPDAPDRYMPLLARLIRKLPTDAGADTVSLITSDIVYNERATVERGFGQVPFRRMSALVTGVRNVLADTAQLFIHATCTAFERAPVDLTFTTRIQDTTDHFDVVASIGSMPFRDLNGAFGPLADIQAMSGMLDTLVMRLSADDRLSRGKVRLAYHDLRMVQGDEATKSARTKPLSVLINAIIPNDRPEGDVSSTDEVYTLSRRRDRSMFNYLWINLREGSKKVVLPGILQK